MGKSYKQEKARLGDDRKNERQLKKEARYDKKERRKGKGAGNNSYDVRELSKVLAEDGLSIRHMDGDGNCLFRSIADQITGNQEMHMAFRKRIMKYIEEHGDHFRLFMEDDESFEAYMSRMSEDGEWGGHQELYAASQCLNVNITVYQLNAPSYILPANIEGKADKDTKPPKNIRISYHGDCHYNSVHPMMEGTNDKTAQADVHANTTNTPGADKTTSIAAKGSMFIPDPDITLVLQSVPWLSREQVTAALELRSGDVDAAVEYLCAEVEEISIDTPPTKNTDNAGTTDTAKSTVAVTGPTDSASVAVVEKEVGHPGNPADSAVVDAAQHCTATITNPPATHHNISVLNMEPAPSTGNGAPTSHAKADKPSKKAKETTVDPGKKEKSYRKSGQQNSKPLSKKEKRLLEKHQRNGSCKPGIAPDSSIATATVGVGVGGEYSTISGGNVIVL